MKILNFDEIKNDFDERIFENSRADLITKLSKYPSRYIGIFRSSTPRTKLIQNITQSHEIKFGDGFEILIRKLFEKFGFESLKLNRKLNNGDTISFDQLMKKENDLLFIEQKVRDDHDSTKKRGQFKNFKVKLDYLVANESFDTLRSYIYFIDSSLTKNKNYYTSEIEKLRTKYVSSINLVYGGELFEHEDMGSVWKEEIMSFLLKWREGLPEFPEINFDLDPNFTFNEIKDLSPNIYKKLLSNDEIIETIFPILFPTGDTLKLLKNYFHSKSFSNDKNGKKYEELDLKLIELGY